MSFQSIPSLLFGVPKRVENSRELVKYITQTDIYEYDLSKASQSNFFCNVKIGYINSKCIKNMKDTGCYIIMIDSQEKNGPNGIFCLSRSNNSKSGVINTLAASVGVNGDTLEIIWNPKEYPCVILKCNFTREQVLSIRDIKLRVAYNIHVVTPN